MNEPSTSCTPDTLILAVELTNSAGPFEVCAWTFNHCDADSRV